MPVLLSVKAYFQRLLSRLLGNDLVVCVDCHTLLKRWASSSCESCHADLCDCENHYTFDGYRYIATCRACTDPTALLRTQSNLGTCNTQPYPTDPSQPFLAV